jgi:hypothetical protein
MYFFNIPLNLKYTKCFYKHNLVKGQKIVIIK